MARDDRRRLRRILGALDRSGVGARAVPMIDGDAMAPLLWLARPDRDRPEGKGGTMDDAEVLGRINELAREEHELFERESHGKVTDADRDRLRRLQVTLDQCWDLLRQRRARRAAGLDPGEARGRAAKAVAGYTGRHGGRREAGDPARTRGRLEAG